jgi:hypothetical protein
MKVENKQFHHLSTRTFIVGENAIFRQLSFKFFGRIPAHFFLPSIPWCKPAQPRCQLDTVDVRSSNLLSGVWNESWANGPEKNF